MLKIKHPNGKLPPHPTKRNKLLKVWKDKLQKINKENKPKTLEEAQNLRPIIQAAEDELDATYSKYYEVQAEVKSNEDLIELIRTYGPLRIGIHEGELLALTEMDYQYPKGLLKKIREKLKKTLTLVK